MDSKLVLRVTECILCFAGVVLFKFTHEFFGRWLIEGLAIGLGGYLIIFTVLLIVSFKDVIPTLMEILFLIVGCILNFLCGIMMIVTYSLRKKTITTHGSQIITESGIELALGCLTTLLSLVMLCDVLIEVIACQSNEDD